MLRHASIRVKPVLGIAPESFDTIDVVTAHRAALFLANHHMLAPQLQRRVGLPLIGVIQRSFPRMGLDAAPRADYATSAAGLDRPTPG